MNRHPHSAIHGSQTRMEGQASMSIQLKTNSGYVFIAMAINCEEYTIKITDKGCEYVECIANTEKAECARCSLVNPNGRLAQGGIKRNEQSLPILHSLRKGRPARRR